jgi:hypothetical protein
MIKMSVENKNAPDRHRSLVEIYEHVGGGGVQIDRPESDETDPAPGERIRSSGDTETKQRPRRPR